MKKINIKIRKLLLKNWFFYSVFVFSLFVAVCFIYKERESIYNGDETNLSGIISSYTITGNKLTFMLEGKENVKCNYYFDTLKELEDFKNDVVLGAIIDLVGELKEPVNNTVPNTFNYKEYLYYKEIFYTCTVDTFEMNANDISPLYAIKNFVIKRILSFPDVSDYLLTFIIGDKSLLDEDAMNNYRLNGVTHLFAISGMHIGLFSACIIGILKRLKISESKCYIVTVLFIWFYAFLTNFTPSVMRAGLLFSLLALNKIFYTEVKGINVLLMTGAILILINPFILKDIGFIYSFVTTFGLMYSSFVLSKHKIIGTSIVAMLFSLPITINNFYEFNILSVLINIIFVPFVSTLVYPLCLLTFIFRFLEPLTHLLLLIMEWMNDMCASVDFLHMITAKMNVLMLLTFYGLLLKLVNKRLILCIILLFGLILINNQKTLFDKYYHAEFFDIGQGDSMILRYPKGGEVVLIDTGGSISYETEEWKKRKKYYGIDNVLTYLKSLGITKIDTLILTHGDFDHMGEAVHLVENFKVEKVLFNNGDYNYLESELIEILKEMKIPYHMGLKELNIKGDKLYFLNSKNYDNENDNSNVIYTELGGARLLLMGDAGREVEYDILKKYNLENIDILKVGHHGSKTSSSEKFINTITPTYSIISVGKSNKFGHPHSEVLENLSNSKIYRTDQDGSIMFKIKNNKLKIETCVP